MTPRSIRSDSEFQKDVSNELEWDTRVRHTDVGVAVKNAVVTLMGTVANWDERLAAEEAAHRVAGVLDVVNQMHVRTPHSYEHTDRDIACAVRNALKRDVLVPDQRIESTVSNGVVTLGGVVETWSKHDDVARAVQKVAGVRAVRNQIAVVPERVEQPVIVAAVQRAANPLLVSSGSGTRLNMPRTTDTIEGPTSQRRRPRARRRDRR